MMHEEIDKVSLLVNEKIEDWQLEALELAVEDHDLEIGPVVIWDRPAQQRNESTLGSTSRRGGILADISLFISMLRNDGPWAIVLAARKIHRTVFGIEQRVFTNQQTESIDLFADSEFIYTDAIPTRTDQIVTGGMGDTWKRLPDEVVRQVATESDVTVRFGFGLIEGDILEATEHGVLSFHSSDITRYRGIASIPRYLDDRAVAGVTLQQLDPTVDGGRVVVSDHVDISDLHLQDEINNRLKDRQVEMLSEGISRLESDFEPQKPEELGEVTLAKRKQEWGFCLKLTLHEAKNASKKALGIPRIRKKSQD